MPGPSGLAVILTTITPCFAGYTMSVNLYIASGAHQEFTNSEENLKTDFNFERAVVTAGTWIFYKHANFNNKESGGNSGDHKILNPGASEDIKSVNGSMYLVRDQTEGIILFTHAYYGGKNKGISCFKDIVLRRFRQKVRNRISMVFRAKIEHVLYSRV
ncbi:uncharacterized protein [Montipora foliosa]|uniref:uncharacterized protein isoform X4 n=1 Tax=Montipora foliosa TaxID=591990 RepID=UPI0035F19404